MLMPNLNDFAAAVDRLLRQRADQRKLEIRTFKNGLAAAAELVNLRQADCSFAALVGALQEAAARLADPSARTTLESLGGARIAASAPTERDVVPPAPIQPEFAKVPKKRMPAKAAIVVDAPNFPAKAHDASPPIGEASAPGEEPQDKAAENAAPFSSSAGDEDVVRGDLVDEPATNSADAENAAEQPRVGVRSVRRPGPLTFASDARVGKLSDEHVAPDQKTEATPAARETVESSDAAEAESEQARSLIETGPFSLVSTTRR